MSELRSKLIRLASTMPKGSTERKTLLEVLAGDKTAGAAAVRRMVTITCYVTSQKPAPIEIPGKTPLAIAGKMTLDFGGATSPDAIRFSAMVVENDGVYTVSRFRSMQAVSGTGGEVLLGVLRNALEELFATKGKYLLRSSEPEVRYSPGEEEYFSNRD